MVISLIAEDENGVSATPETAARWPDYAQTNISYAVIPDPNWELTYRFTGRVSLGLPTMQLIKPGMEVVEVNTRISKGDLEQYLRPAAD